MSFRTRVCALLACSTLIPWGLALARRFSEGRPLLGLALLGALSLAAGLAAAAMVWRREAEQEETQSELFHKIAHDMRGSLAVIEGGADIMVRLPAMPDKALKYARAMRSAGRTLNGMVKDILNWNKLEAGTMQLSLAPVSVNGLLASLREAHEAPAEMRRVAMVDVPLGTDVVLTADRGLVERVLANLVGNALKLTPSGGRVELSCPAIEENSVCFCVTDTGPGVPEEKKDRLFHGFMSPDGKSRGYEMGLAMCRMAVELHGGRIWVESEAGKGSRFLFTLSRRLKPSA